MREFFYFLLISSSFSMKTFHFSGGSIHCQLAPASKETGFISEDFDFHKKPAVLTCGVQELFSDSCIAQSVAFTIFDFYHQEAKKKKLDYLQKISINGVSVWLLDNGSDICLLLPEEY
jgi:hypothetical protein